MDIRCERCQAEYVFKDDQIGSAGLSVRCSRCGNVFRVKKPEASAAASPSAAAPRAAGAAPKAGAPRPWTLRKRRTGTTYPFKEFSILQKWVSERRAVRDDEASFQGGPWRRLGDIPELAPFFATAEARRRGGAPAADHDAAATLIAYPPAKSSPVFPGPGLPPPSAKTEIAFQIQDPIEQPLDEAQAQEAPAPLSQIPEEPVFEQAAAQAGADLRELQSITGAQPLGADWEASASAAQASKPAANDAAEPAWADDAILQEERTVTREELRDHVPVQRRSGPSFPAAQSVFPQEAEPPVGVPDEPPPHSPGHVALIAGLAVLVVAAAAVAVMRPSWLGMRPPSAPASPIAGWTPSAAPPPVAPPRPAPLPAPPKQVAPEGTGVPGTPSWRSSTKPQQASAAAKPGKPAAESNGHEAEPWEAVEPAQAGQPAEAEKVPEAKPSAKQEAKKSKRDAKAGGRDQAKGLLDDARELRIRGRSEAAIDAYNKVLERDGRNVSALAGRGLCYLDLGQYSQAENSFETALRVDARNPDALMGLAETYRYESRKEDAITYYQKYLTAHPKGAGAAAARNAIHSLRQ
jgi:predicted Zn finger-like uncharacterized protein